MALLGLFRRKKEDPEIARRNALLRHGRLGEATVLGLDVDSEGNEVLSYLYTVGGAEYEAVQLLDAEQLQRKAKYTPGAVVTLRYDPRRPANALVV